MHGAKTVYIGGSEVEANSTRASRPGVKMTGVSPVRQVISRMSLFAHKTMSLRIIFRSLVQGLERQYKLADVAENTKLISVLSS